MLQTPELLKLRNRHRENEMALAREKASDIELEIEAYRTLRSGQAKARAEAWRELKGLEAELSNFNKIAFNTQLAVFSRCRGDDYIATFRELNGDDDRRIWIRDVFEAELGSISRNERLIYSRVCVAREEISRNIEATKALLKKIDAEILELSAMISDLEVKRDVTVLEHGLEVLSHWRTMRARKAIEERHVARLIEAMPIFA